MAKKEAPKSEGFVPSMCGSHLEMEAKDEKIQIKPELAEKLILLKDDRGLYVTERWRLISASNIMADCNRLAPDETRKQKLEESTEAIPEPAAPAEKEQA